jgi:cytoskeletal protein CcmA (bactofilin family)
MFAKSAKGDIAAPEPQSPARRAIAASLIAEDVTFKGDLSTSGDLQLDGAVEGDLVAGRLTVGERGQVSGTIQAQAVDIRGRVTGMISARVVRLFASAQVNGDISHGELSIEAGAHFVGRSLELPAEAPAALSIVAAE